MKDIKEALKEKVTIAFMEVGKERLLERKKTLTEVHNWYAGLWGNLMADAMLEEIQKDLRTCANCGTLVTRNEFVEEAGLDIGCYNESMADQGQRYGHEEFAL